MLDKPSRAIATTFLRRLQRKRPLWFRSRVNGALSVPLILSDLPNDDQLFYLFGRSYDSDTQDVIILTDIESLGLGARPWVRLSGKGYDVETIVADWDERLDDVVRPILAAMIAERENPARAELDA